MSRRHTENNLKIIKTFDEQYSSLNADELKIFLKHVRERLNDDDDDDNDKESSEKTNDIFSRICLLSFLLLLQSGSSFILQSFSDLISKHILITMYLTMLVGAGGNAGNQAAVLVIRGN